MEGSIGPKCRGTPVLAHAAEQNSRVALSLERAPPAPENRRLGRLLRTFRGRVRNQSTTYKFNRLESNGHV